MKGRTEKIQVNYVTSSAFKKEENRVLSSTRRLKDGRLVGDVFEFRIRAVSIKELLEIDIKALVTAEVVSAYGRLKVPCVVEHAGLVFSDFIDKSYPGGLTKPMWNALGPKFVDETGSEGRRAVAQAVVAYCDGAKVHTFSSERAGVIVSPRGNRQFYWDTVFVPDENDGSPGSKTYAEISEDPAGGIAAKVEISQSSAAMLSLLEYLVEHPFPMLWP